MSETIINLKATFKEISEAKQIIENIKKTKENSLKTILSLIEKSDEYTSQIDDIWYIENLQRKKNTNEIKIIGPPSGGNIDIFFDWLYKYGAYKINGDYYSTMADIEPVPFSIYEGKSIEPNIDIDRVIKNHPGDSMDINKKDGAGHTPLHYAAERCAYKLAKALLEAGADVHARNKANNIPLAVVFNDENSEEKQIKMIELFLNFGADINFTYESGETFVDIAIKNIQPEVANYLLEKGAKSNSLQKFNLEPNLMKRIYEMTYGDLISDKHINILNNEKIPPLYGDEKWDWDMVYKATKIAEKLEQEGKISFDIKD